MTNSLRQDILRKLELISELAPELRFCQLRAGIDQLIADLQRRQQSVA